jgi:hypothetical protein
MPTPPGRRFLVCLLPCLLLSLLLLVFPLYVIRPFRAQGARELGPTRYATMIDMPAC